ncbi:hypothetical protein, unlikely [Trypanosoma brucei gambiense DAL972]|uniref:T. brucei spp.-specific protein n=1 Tax=Trypanosoma brucei gambiense (strain MHOM/CI/86/DAL972) TaxID=679716 RepID=C9ZIS7_TRYB9|nr:hypothetical protein, unlikely [Trypanosoma brucei gambiense DAL972]CBH09069.1 hypothetical protein, unlikely [Trypanosoma brucei gambiense DAL972]|eukprot:XP_011771510.1 hypothetical protein, unlikely [Trypanosoma brucei gambiense DAL972]
MRAIVNLFASSSPVMLAFLLSPVTNSVSFRCPSIYALFPLFKFVLRFKSTSRLRFCAPGVEVSCFRDISNFFRMLPWEFCKME